MSHVLIPDPTFSPTFRDWAHRINEISPADELGNFGMMDWKTWAKQLYNRPNFQEKTIPDPLLYADWRAWARDLKLCHG